MQSSFVSSKCMAVAAPLGNFVMKVMSEKSSTFMDMNDEMKLRLAYAEIASLNEKISKLTAMLEKSAISETETKWLASVTTWQNK